MKSFSFAVTVQAAGEADAELARDEVTNGLQDARDSGEIPNLDFDVSPLRAQDDPDTNDANDARVIEAACDIHAIDGEVEVDGNAVVSYSSDGGAYVAAWVWVPNSAIHEKGGFNPETDSDTSSTTVTHLPGDPVRTLEVDVSEGGHCD